jgi:hypothetical protein
MRLTQSLMLAVVTQILRKRWLKKLATFLWTMIGTPPLTSTKCIHGFFKEQIEMTEKLNVHQAAVEKAIKLLDAAGADYAIQFDGKFYGTLEVKPPRKEGRNRVYAHGETRSHYLPYIENLEVGQGASVPFSYFDRKILSSNISAYCVHKWGAGSAMVKKNELFDSLEVLRLS